MAHELSRLAPVALHVHPGEVRQRTHELERLLLQNQTALLTQPPATEQPPAVLHPQLEGHVQAIELPGRPGAQAGEIVDAEPRLSHDLHDPGQTQLARVRLFQRNPGTEAEHDDDEEEGPKKLVVVKIERTVDEDVPIELGRRVRHAGTGERCRASDWERKLWTYSGISCSTLPLLR
ncbi:MAG TPA: hypothetical protein VFR81_14470 [Longimicrobium sp.]|nr:hypothetical protein [Longimicrobium sp.]